MRANDTDLPLLLDAARAAGVIAARHFGTGPDSWDKGCGQGPVSVADLEIDRMLRTTLTAARPTYGWLSEETEDDPSRLTRPHAFVVDPIDGTRAFLDGQTTFAHALAVVHDGIPVAGVVHLPLQDLTYSAVLGGGAWLNGVRLTTPLRQGLTGARLLATRPVMAAAHWPGGVPDIARHFRPSLAWRLALVAEGRFDGMVTLRDTWNWDIAASTLIAREAGATVTDRFGAALRFNTPRPMTAGVLAGSEPVHAGLLSHLGMGAQDMTGTRSTDPP